MNNPPITQAILSGENEDRLAAIGRVLQMGVGEEDKAQLLGIADDKGQDVNLRLAALDNLCNQIKPQGSYVLELLLRLRQSESPALRLAATDWLAVFAPDPDVQTQGSGFEPAATGIQWPNWRELAARDSDPVIRWYAQLPTRPKRPTE